MTDSIDMRIQKLNAQIDALTRERDDLCSVRQNGLLSEAAKNKSLKDRRSVGKLRTLSLATEFIIEANIACTTRAMISFFRNARHDIRSGDTIRSHLRRLRDDGLLEFNQKTKQWSLPINRN